MKVVEKQVVSAGDTSNKESLRDCQPEAYSHVASTSDHNQIAFTSIRRMASPMMGDAAQS
jgi:hypothetical protein